MFSTGFNLPTYYFWIKLCLTQGIKNFTRTAANLLAAMTKIDNSYYPEVWSFPNNLGCPILYCYITVSSNPQTLHRMYIVNAGPGFKKMLWPAAQKFLDVKTIAKIQVRDMLRPIISQYVFPKPSAEFVFIFQCFRFWNPNHCLNYWKS